MGDSDLEEEHIFDEGSGILQVSRSDGASEEQLLPVHFLPEGKKCYDWIDDELRKESKSSEHQSIESKENDLTASSEPPSKQILRASEEGLTDLVKKLIILDPNLIQSQDSDNYTPLHRACYNGHVETAKLLIQNGADVRAKTVDGWEPLHSACRWNQLGTSYLLLNNGACVNAQSNGGLTALHLAATSSDRCQLLEMLLLRQGVDCNIKTKADETPHNIAWRNGEHEKIFELGDETLNVDLKTILKIIN